MSRSIVVLDTGASDRLLADALGRALGRRVITEPSPHPDEVILLPADALEDLDLDLACVLAPTGSALAEVLTWALERGDVLTRSEHEQVMP